MSNYSQITFFAPKDSLLSGNPAKIIKGADVDPEFAAISVAIATKYDSLNSFSAPIQFADGAVGAPAVTFHSDTTTGIYKSAAGVAAITASGVLEAGFGGGVVCGAPTGGHQGVGTLNVAGSNGAALYFNGTVLTGISPTWTGTHTFNNPLTVNGTAGGGGFSSFSVSTNANTTVDIKNSNTGTAAQAQIRLINSADNLVLGIRSTGFTGAATWTNGPGGEAVDFGTTGAIPISIATNLVERVRISSTGIVTLNAPSAANATLLFINGQTNSANTFLVNITTGTAAGFSSGLVINAGTNSSDSSLLVRNAAGSVNYLQVAGGGQILGGGPVAGALVDMTPDIGSFTITYTGFSSATTGTAVWSRNGNQVTLVLPVATNTSNATTFTATGIPAAINPARAQNIPLFGGNSAENNGTTNNAVAVTVNTNNTLTFGLGAYNTAWTASGTKGILLALVCQYLLN